MASNPLRKDDKNPARRRAWALPPMWSSFWDFVDEMHHWQGLYTRRAFGLRPALYSVGVLLLQLLLGRLLVWFYVFVPLALSSVLWVWCCSMAKRLRHRGHAPLGYVLMILALGLLALLAFVELLPSAPMVYRGSVLVLLVMLVYIAISPAKKKEI